MRIIIFIIIFAMSIIDSSLAQKTVCDYKVEILLNSSEFETKDFSWRMKATKNESTSTNITGFAEIQDSKGKIVKSYKPWTNESISKQKTSNVYSPNLKEGQYKIKAYIDVECDDINKDNNVDIKIIKIKEYKVIASAVNQSNSQSTFVEDTINNPIKNETINQSIIDKKIENKTLSKNESEKLVASEEDNVIQLKNNDKKEMKPITAAAVKEQVIFKSSNEKSKELIVFFLLALSIFLNIILIWKR